MLRGLESSFVLLCGDAAEVIDRQAQAAKANERVEDTPPIDLGEPHGVNQIGCRARDAELCRRGERARLSGQVNPEYFALKLEQLPDHLFWFRLEHLFISIHAKNLGKTHQALHKGGF